MPITGIQSIDAALQIGTAAVTFASVVVAFTPKTGPAWWVATRAIITKLAVAVGNASPAK